MTVTPTASDTNATIRVNGTIVASGSASANIPLTVGSNTINVVVTAQDGTTTNTYTITVTRASSSNADLSNLTVSQGTLTPAFATATTSYTDSVINSVTGMTVTPTASDTTATIRVNGTIVASGAALSRYPPGRGKQHHHRSGNGAGRLHYKDLYHHCNQGRIKQCRPEQPHGEPGHTQPGLCSCYNKLYGWRRQQRDRYDRHSDGI